MKFEMHDVCKTPTPWGKTVPSLLSVHCSLEERPSEQGVVLGGGGANGGPHVEGALGSLGMGIGYLPTNWLSKRKNNEFIICQPIDYLITNWLLDNQFINC